MKRKQTPSSSLSNISEGYGSESGDEVQEKKQKIDTSEENLSVPTNDSREEVSRSIVDISSPSEEFDIEQVNGFSACSTVENYEFLNNIGSGTFGVVSRGKCKETGEIVALKRIKLMKDYTSREGFPLTALREINGLLQMRHENLVCAREVVCGSDLNKIFIVMDYMDHTLKDVLDRYRFSVGEVKRLMIQLLSGLHYMHGDCWLLHRDLKTSNILIDNKGGLKICDYGLARKYGSPIRENYTPVVVTLWYRAPELLLGARRYSTPIDMWSIGCIFYEIITGEPLFMGKDEIDQIKKIFSILGKPTDSEYPGFSQLPAVRKFKFPSENPKGRQQLIQKLKTQYQISDNGCDLMNRLLCYDPEKRISTQEALDHPFFREAPLPQTKENMPTFPSIQTIDSSKRKEQRSESKKPAASDKYAGTDAYEMEQEFKRFIQE